MKKEEPVGRTRTPGTETETQKQRGLVKTASVLSSTGALLDIPSRTVDFIADVIRYGVDKKEDFSPYISKRRGWKRFAANIHENIADLDDYLSGDVTYKDIAAKRKVDETAIEQRIQKTLYFLRDVLLATLPESIRSQKSIDYAVLHVRHFQETQRRRREEAGITPTTRVRHFDQTERLLQIAQRSSELASQGLSNTQIAKALQQDFPGLNENAIRYAEKQWAARQQAIAEMPFADKERFANGLTLIRQQIEQGLFFHPDFTVYSFIRDAIHFNLDKILLSTPVQIKALRNIPRMMANFEGAIGQHMSTPELAKAQGVTAQNILEDVKNLTEFLLRSMPQELQQWYRGQGLRLPGQHGDRTLIPTAEQRILWNRRYEDHVTSFEASQEFSSPEESRQTEQDIQRIALQKIFLAVSKSVPGIAIFTYQIPTFGVNQEIQNPRIGFVSREDIAMEDTQNLSHEAQVALAKVMGVIRSSPSTPSSRDNDTIEINENPGENNQFTNQRMKRVIIAIETSRCNFTKDENGNLIVTNKNGNKLTSSEEIRKVIELIR